jgi:hypothetical protein
MKRVLSVTFTLAPALSPIAEARKPSSHPYIQQAEPNESDLESHSHYKNKDGRDVHSPSKSKSGKAPQAATAQCCDSSYSFSAFMASIRAGRENETNQHGLERSSCQVAQPPETTTALIMQKQEDICRFNI